MMEASIKKYPVFVMCGRDVVKRKLLKKLDPKNIYPSKALLPFLGKRLIDWQLDELQQSPYVEGLYLIGLSEADAKFDYPVHYVPVDSTADVADKFLAGLAYLENLGKNPELIVISTSDTPGIRVDQINEFFGTLTMLKGVEFALSVVPEKIIEEVFPGSGRVVMRFSDQQVIPGELFALSPRAIRIGEGPIREFSQRRRQINRQRKNISVGPFIRYFLLKPSMWMVIPKYLMGKASIGDAERAFSSAFRCQTRGVIIADAGFGMDMDLPEDFQRLEEFVRKLKLSKAGEIINET